MQRGSAWKRIAAAVAERYPSRCLDPAGTTRDERVGEILDALAPGAVAVGYSMGGRLALDAALRDPGRLGALVVVGVSAGIEDPAERVVRAEEDEALAALIERSPIEEVVERWERNPVFGTQSEALVAAQRPGRLSHEPAALAALLRSAGQGAMEPLWDRLGELRCPVLAVAGEHDERYSAAARRIAAATGGNALVLAGAGHAPHLEQPDAFAAALLAFLASHDPPRPAERS